MQKVPEVVSMVRQCPTAPVGAGQYRWVLQTENEVCVCTAMLRGTEWVCPLLTVSVVTVCKYEGSFVTEHHRQFWIFACHAKREKSQFLK